MIQIKLLGECGQRFIEEFEAEINSVSDLIVCLQANFSEFTEYLVNAAERGIGFHIRVGYQDIDESHLSKPFAQKVKRVTLTPIPVGSGGGFGRILMGVVLIGAGLLSGGAGFLGISSTTLILTGGTMLLGGIASLFGKTNSPSDDEKNGKRSMVFSGGAQTVQEGSRIPIVYGRKHRVGIFVLSARVTTYPA